MRRGETSPRHAHPLRSFCAGSTDVSGGAPNARRFARPRVGTWNDGARHVHVSQSRRRAGDRRSRAFQSPRRARLSRRHRTARRDELDDELGNSPLLSRSGAHIGDVARAKSGASRSPTASRARSRTARPIELQAAVASFEVPPVGSNIVRLIARSRPHLGNALTGIAIEAPREPVPGREAQVTVRMHNAGESSARDVVVVAPIPEHATYVADSARVNGREIERELGAPFDRIYAPIVTRRSRLELGNPRLSGGASIRRCPTARRSWRERAGGFARDAAVRARAGIAPVVSTPDFDDERTDLYGRARHDVRRGSASRSRLTAFNAGSAAAENVSAHLELPDSLFSVRGASTIDGRPVRERRKEPLRFELGAIDAGESVTLCAEAVLASPLAERACCSQASRPRMGAARANASRRLECGVAVHSEPAFPVRRNAIERTGGAIVTPGGEVEATIVARERRQRRRHDVVLHLRIDPAARRARRLRERTSARARRTIGSGQPTPSSSARSKRTRSAANHSRARALAISRSQRTARRRERAHARVR